MTKLGIFFIIAILINALAGCQGTMGGSPQTPPPVETRSSPSAESTAPPETTLPVAQELTQETLISREEAKKIALDNAKLKESEVRDLEVELDRDDGTIHYDVDFEKDGKDYDYEIDAKTGKILRSETPPVKSESKPEEETKQQLTAAQARDIALKHAKLKASEVRDLEVELDKDDGKQHFDVSFEKDNIDYDYEIDAYSGKILKSEKEKD